MRLPHALATTTAALALVLAGCSSSGPESSGNGFNDADVDFASDMIQHHAQALEMVDLTMGRDLDPEFAELTERIRAAQAPEIEKMADWLTAWDQPVPETGRDHANAHSEDHGAAGMDEDMPGMMSGQDMEALESAPDAEFRDLWLQMMIEHHEGAVEMAEDEVEQGVNADAVALAEEIIAAQEKEISTMQALVHTP
jgi:uncharacterized protein (DUF305 family)